MKNKNLSIPTAGHQKLNVGNHKLTVGYHKIYVGQASRLSENSWKRHLPHKQISDIKGGRIAVLIRVLIFIFVKL